MSNVATIFENLPDKRLVWRCPGCKCHHQVPVSGPAAWEFNGSIARPTLRPSVLVTYGDRPPTDRPARCHCFIDEGSIHFLDDCAHDLAGKHVPMEAWE